MVQQVEMAVRCLYICFLGVTKLGVITNWDNSRLKKVGRNQLNWRITHFVDPREHSALLSSLAITVGLLGLLGEKEVLHILSTRLWILDLLADALWNPAGTTIREDTLQPAWKRKKRFIF